MATLLDRPTPDLDAPPVVDAAVVDPDYPLERVPLAKRRGPVSVTIVMAGFVFFVPTLVTGGLVSASTGFGPYLPIAAVAAGVLALYIGVLGLISARTGLSTVLVARMVLGKVGGKWASVLLGGTQVGWYAITVAVLGDLVGQALGLETTWPIVVVGGIGMAATAYFGIKGIEILSWVKVPLMLGLCLWVTFRAFSTAGGLSGLLGFDGDGSIPLAAAMTMLIATFISGGTQVGNWSRFSTPKIGTLWLVVGGVFLIQGAMLFFGAVGTAAYGISDFAELLLTMGLAGAGLFLVVANLWTTNDNTAYAYGVAGAELFGKNDKRPFIIGGTVVAIVLAVTGVTDALPGFLIMLGTLVPPLGGVIIGTFFLVWKGKDPMTAIDGAPAVVWSAVLAYAAGVAAAFLTNELAWGIPPLQGIVVAAVAAPLLAKVLPAARPAAVVVETAQASR